MICSYLPNSAILRKNWCLLITFASLLMPLFSYTPYLSTHSINDQTILDAFKLPLLPKMSAKEIVDRGLLPPSYKLAPPSPGKKIPRIIWIAVKNASDELPGSMHAFLKRNSEWQVNLVGNEDKDAFIDVVFSNTSVQFVYHVISPLLGAAKADIWRYLVLYLFGGVYIDYDSDLGVPLDTIVQPDDTLILSEEGADFFECYIPTYPLSSNSTFRKYGVEIASTAGPRSTTLSFAPTRSPETGLPIFFGGKFLVQWAMIAAPENPLFLRTISNLIDLVFKDYFRETVILLRKHTHRMVQLLCTTNYVMTASLRHLLLEGGVSGKLKVFPRIMHRDFREYKGLCKAIWTGSDQTHYRKIMRIGHKGHDLLRSYTGDPALLVPAARALEGWAISSNAAGRSVFKVINGVKKLVPDMDAFQALKLTFDEVLHIPDVVFALIPAGPPIAVSDPVV